jgi:hypothetical protein
VRQVRRIPTPSPEDVLARLVPAREPLVLEGFLAGTALEQVSTAKQARAHAGAVPLELREEFVAWSLARGGAPDVRPRMASTVAGYLDLLEREPATPWMCTEHPTPKVLLDALGAWPHALAPDGGLASFTFVGGRGHHAHLHYDGDFRSVLLVQVFGVKRALLATPDASPSLQPVGNFAGVFVDRLEGAAREGFVGMVGGLEAELGPGDALLMPAAMWHHLDYPETGMSINLRFAPSPSAAALAGRFHAHDGLQRIAWHFADHHEPRPEEAQGLERLLAMAGPGIGEPVARALAIERVTAGLADAWAGPRKAPAFIEASGRLHEAARAYEAARLYPPAASALAAALGGWGTVAAGPS